LTGKRSGNRVNCTRFSPCFVIFITVLLVDALPVKKLTEDVYKLIELVCQALGEAISVRETAPEQGSTFFDRGEKIGHL
jgi:hypothetical protein